MKMKWKDKGLFKGEKALGLLWIFTATNRWHLWSRSYNTASCSEQLLSKYKYENLSQYTNIEIKSEFPTPLDTFVDVLVTSAALPGPGTPVTSVPPRTPHPHTAVLLTEVRAALGILGCKLCGILFSSILEGQKLRKFRCRFRVFIHKEELEIFKPLNNWKGISELFGVVIIALHWVVLHLMKWSDPRCHWTLHCTAQWHWCDTGHPLHTSHIHRSLHAALLSTGNTPLLTAALSSLLFVTLRASQRLVSGRHYRHVILTSIFKIKILSGQVSQTQLKVYALSIRRRCKQYIEYQMSTLETIRGHGSRQRGTAALLVAGGRQAALRHCLRVRGTGCKVNGHNYQIRRCWDRGWWGAVMETQPHSYQVQPMRIDI